MIESQNAPLSSSHAYKCWSEANMPKRACDSIGLLLLVASTVSASNTHTIVLLSDLRVRDENQNLTQKLMRVVTLEF